MKKIRKRDTLLLVEKGMINVRVKVDIEEDREAMTKKLKKDGKKVNIKLPMIKEK